VNKNKAEWAQADADSAAIADLKRAIEELVLRGAHPGEGIMIEARQLAHQWRAKAGREGLARPLFDGNTPRTTLLLAGLVVALIPDHRLLEQIRRHYDKSEELNLRWHSLRWDSFLADILAAYLPRTPKLTPKQAWESKRRREHFHLIEWEYGGDLTALFRKVYRFDPEIGSHEDLDLRLREWLMCGRQERLKDSAMPNCLDDIFNGGRVNMLRLEALFGMERHQFPKNLPNTSKGRETFYDYRAVVTIMDALLSEKLREKRRKSGRPPRIPWLNDSQLRMHVLSGIETRIDSLSVQEHIKATFLAVVRRHLPDSGKK
jgi:hypothetical protein